MDLPKSLFKVQWEGGPQSTYKTGLARGLILTFWILTQLSWTKTAGSPNSRGTVCVAFVPDTTGTLGNWGPRPQQDIMVMSPEVPGNRRRSVVVWWKFLLTGGMKAWNMGSMGNNSLLWYLFRLEWCIWCGSNLQWWLARSKFTWTPRRILVPLW